MSNGLTHEDQQVLIFVLREKIAVIEAEMKNIKSQLKNKDEYIAGISDKHCGNCPHRGTENCPDHCVRMSELEAELQLHKDLSEHARHDHGCSAAVGNYPCRSSCGFAEAKEAVDNFEKGKK